MLANSVTSSRCILSGIARGVYSSCIAPTAPIRLEYDNIYVTNKYLIL